MRLAHALATRKLRYYVRWAARGIVHGVARKSLEGALSGPVSFGTPIRGIDELLLPFYTSLKPRSQWRVGTEAQSSSSKSARYTVFKGEGRLPTTAT